MSMIIDGTNGLTFNNATTQNSGGQVLQVISVSSTTTFSTSSTTLADSGLAASITPKFSTSKIFIITSINGIYTNAQANATTKMQIARGGTGVSGTVFNNFISSATGLITGNPITYLDSPATTSSTTYSLQFARSGGNTVYINYSNDVSTITLMEIAQ